MVVCLGEEPFAQEVTSMSKDDEDDVADVGQMTEPRSRPSGLPEVRGEEHPHGRLQLCSGMNRFLGVPLFERTHNQHNTAASFPGKG